jgi:putative PEP-CTERM system histidine kinase
MAIMENYSFYGYITAAFGYFLLLILALKRNHGNPVNVFFILAVCSSIVWSGYTAFALQNPTAYISETLPLETLCYATWFFFLIILILHQHYNGKYALLIKSWRTYALLLLILMTLVLETVTDFQDLTRYITGHDLRFFAHTCFAILGLVLIEQLYRNADAGQRWSIKFLCLGLSTIFVVDFVLYSKSLLFEKLNYPLWDSRGFIHVVTLPLLAISIGRLQLNAEATKFSVSRKAVFHTTALFGTGIYLILMSLAGYYIMDYGGSWGKIAQTVFISLATLLLLILLFSGKIRAQAKVFLNKHFFQDNYDYREEWLKLSNRLAKLDSPDKLSGFIINTMADLVDSSSGGVWLKDENNDYYLACENNLGLHSMQLIKSVDPVIQFLITRHWIIDFVEYSHEPQAYPELDLSPWLTEIHNIWLIIPLFQQNEMLGFVILSKAKVFRQLNWEDRDMLKTVSMQLTNALALRLASNELSQSRQFEAYNRLSAYLVHDLKNLAAQIQLIVKNAETFKNNPEFIDDTLETLNNVSKKLQHLVAQLNKDNYSTTDQDTGDLVKIVADVAVQQAANTPPLKIMVLNEKCLVRGDPAKITAILGHLVQNAQEATAHDGQVKIQLSKDQQQAIIKVIDNGSGMDYKFIAERLFKPFDTTKGNAGMGIGVYEARDYILKQSGQFSVESTPGQGTVFTISLPLIQSRG